MAKIAEIVVGKELLVGVGKFESVRLTAQIKISADDSKDDMDAIFRIGYEMVDEKLNKELADIQGIVKSDSVFLIEDKSDKQPTKPRRRRP